MVPFLCIIRKNFKNITIAELFNMKGEGQSKKNAGQ